MTETAVPGPAANVTTEGDTTEHSADGDEHITDDIASTDEQGRADAQADADRRPEGDQDENPRAEAIKWRRQYRAAQADLAAMAARLEQQQQSIVDTIATARGVDPRLLSTAGHTLESLSDERGVIDQAAILEAVAAVAREFRIAQPVKPNPQQGKAGPVFGASTWAEVFRNS